MSFAARAGKGKAAIVIGLVLCLSAAGAMLARRGGALRGAPSPTSYAPAAATMANGFSPAAPAKEYIYAGGRLVATEEPVNSALLYGSMIRSAGPVNLTQEGTLDWAHWGLSGPTSFNHRAGVTPQISNYTVVGSASVGQYGDNRFPYSWSNGTPTASANTWTGVYINVTNAGFQLTVPADTTVRTLQVYVGVWRAQGRMQASLSDNSAPAFTDSGLNNSTDTSNGLYTFNYRAASAGQTLTVTYTLQTNHYSPWGNITLQAATLSGGGANGDRLIGNPSSQTAGVNLTQQGGLDWAHWGLSSPASFNHRSGVAQQISNYSMVGGNGAGTYGDHRFAFSWTDGTPTASATTTTGLYVNGSPGNGFRITVPADTTTRVVRVYVGVWYAHGRMEAQLSDNSAPVYVDRSVNNNGGSTDGLHTIRYRAASAGQTLTITYTMQSTYYSPYGNVTMQAATLATQ